MATAPDARILLVIIMKSIYVVIAVMVLAMVNSGCGLSADQDEAKAVVARHYKQLSDRQYELALDDYAPEFFERISKAKWRKMLETVSTKLGDLNGYNIVGFRVMSSKTTSGSGTSIVYQCKVNYSKYDADETIRLFKGSGDEKYLIVGHQINSDGLLAE